MAESLTKGDAMFWKFLAVAISALLLIKFGMLAVWVAVLSAGFQVSLFVIAALIAAIIWKKVSQGRERKGASTEGKA